MRWDRLLQRMLPTCQVRTENTQAIVGHPGLRPDILITASWPCAGGDRG